MTTNAKINKVNIIHPEEDINDCTITAEHENIKVSRGVIS